MVSSGLKKMSLVNLAYSRANPDDDQHKLTVGGSTFFFFFIIGSSSESSESEESEERKLHHFSSCDTIKTHWIIITSVLFLYN